MNCIVREINTKNTPKSKFTICWKIMYISEVRKVIEQMIRDDRDEKAIPGP